MEGVELFLSHTAIGKFVLQHGRAFTPRPLPKEFGKPRQNQLCFNNSLEAALSYNLIYVEGYAAGIIPVHHAWCTDKDGNIYDLTWKEGTGTYYFGIPFKRKFLIDYHMKYVDAVSLLDHWKKGWPLLRNDYRPKEFIHRWAKSIR